MLLRQTGSYAVARGVPAVFSLLAIVAFSRLLSPDEYGRYTLVVAAVGLSSALLYQWLRLSLLRFLPQSYEAPERLLSPILSAFLGIVGLTGLAGGVALLAADAGLRVLLGLGVLLLWAQGWFELTRELARGRLSPALYGRLSVAKAVLALVLGWLLAMAGLGAVGVLVGLIAGLLLPSVVFGAREWGKVRPGRFELRRHGHLLAYGLPLALNVVLVWVVASSDRLLIGWLLDVDAAGLYAVGYDLAQYAVGLVFGIVNLAAYPLIVRALEREGVEAAREQLRANARLLLAMGIPTAAGLALLAPALAELLLGPDFRATAAVVIPWIALAAAMAGLKAFHFDLAFQLGKRTMMQVWVSLAAAGGNLGLNLLWIPSFGVLGAAYASVVAYALALVSSAVLGRFAFPVPWTWSDLWRVGLAALLMAGAMNASLQVLGKGLPEMAIAILLGGSVFTLTALVADVAGLRRPVFGWFVTRGKA